MSSQPPSQTAQDLKMAVSNNMAVAQSAKTKASSKPSSNNNSNNATPKTKSQQQHRRSRNGCYTCRLRRKKCDEGSPACKACNNLGLCCEYKRPMWWSNNDARRAHKDEIKNIIKRKKLSEKASHAMQPSINSPPGLSHSIPTSATYSDPLDRTRSASIDSQFAFNFNTSPHLPEYGSFTPQIHPGHSDMMFTMSPYEIDVKTERQMFVDNVPTIRESTVSTFSTYHTPPPPGTVLSYPYDNEWSDDLYQESRKQSLSEETLNCNFFDFSHGPATTSRQVNIELDEGDQRLLDHFVQHVLPASFPILDSNQHGSVGSDLILPALQNNKSYLHCCLMIAAQHYKATMNPQGTEMDNDIMRHRHAAIASLCESLANDDLHQQSLEATLGLIFFQASVSRYDDTLPDIPWHQHFQAVESLVNKMGLPQLAAESHDQLTQTPFNMTLASWIDILGATMQGRAPSFAHAYREKHLSTVNPSMGLRELMGCEDRVMYLISEIACLEALKNDGMDDISLCQHVHALGDQIGMTEQGDQGPKMPFNANGTLSPKQLSKNITIAFRLAARIYLCSLVPGFSPSQASCVGLVDKLTHALQHIPSGLGGFDRSLSWIYLVGGSVSTAGSGFRHFFQDRVEQLGEAHKMGSFGGVTAVLSEVWRQADSHPSPSASGNTEAPYVSWRDVMQMKGWDYLLI